MAIAASGWANDTDDLRKSQERSAGLACVADIPTRTPDDIIAALFARPQTTAARWPGSDPKRKARRCSRPRAADPQVIGEAFA